tara:strand:+ start:796 stop:1404 length:609 start_codon:yes stop_codon:yes gene_type:complete
MNNKRPSILNKLVRRLNILIDSFFGYDFLKVIPLKELNLDPEIVVQGSPSGNKYLKKLLKSLHIKYNDKILDIGCAKGSALKVMLSYPFKKIDGLELSPELVKIAKRNFQKLKTNKVEIFNENATCFMGYNNYNYFYLYNPFPKKIFEKFIKRINEQIKNKEIFIIYNNPVCHDLLIDSNFLLVEKFPDAWGNGINLYKKSF